MVTLTFKTYHGEYKVIHRDFKDDRHMENFVALMSRKYNYKLIGYENRI
jgi:hypothetical protein